MSFVQNFPFFSIIIAMFSGIVSSVLPAKLLCYWDHHADVCCGSCFLPGHRGKLYLYDGTFSGALG